MLPVLQIGPLAIQTYPLALVLAGWLALAVGARAARRFAIDGDHIYNAGLYGLVAGVIVARFAHVIAFWSAYRTQPLEIFGFNTTAFLLWPGVVAGLAVAGWYVYRHRLRPLSLMDAFAPGLLLGLAISSVGALLAGRNPGAQTNVPWSVLLWGVRRHPVQVYEAIGLMAVGGFVLLTARSGRKSGVAFFTALLGWGLVEWFVEAFRATEVTPTVVGGLRLLQVIGLLAALLALLGLRSTRPPVRAARDEDDSPLGL